MEQAHVSARFPKAWGGSSRNPERSYTLLNRESPEFLRFVNPGDLRVAAEVLRGRKVKPGLRMLVVPGSEAVRRAAEAEGLHEVFIAAGAEWRIPGCSMCIAMNGDFVAPGQLAVSTSNRNFEGRQGKDARTILASPATAAATAVAGVLTDPRVFLNDAVRETAEA